jgi:hypothetical protein
VIEKEERIFFISFFFPSGQEGIFSENEVERAKNE